MRSGKAALTLLLLAFTVATAAYIVSQRSPRPTTEAGNTSTNSTAAASIPPPTDAHGILVETAEEAAEVLNASGPVRLLTRIPEDLKYVKILVLRNVGVYVFYSDEPLPDTDNPFVLIYMHWGCRFADVTGGEPKIVLMILKLESEEAAVMASMLDTEEEVEEYAREYNLTVRYVDGIPVFGFDPRELRIWREPIGVVHFYVGDVSYLISTHLSYEEMVEIARSIIEQF